MKKWQAYLLVAILIIGIYGRTATFGYVELDDSLLIVDGQSFLRDLSNIPTAFRTDVFDVRFHPSSAMYYRPVLVVTLMLDAQLGGIEPFVYHLTNILIHLLACWAIFTLLLRLQYRQEWSLLVTLLFAAHPALVQAVAWVPGRNDSLLTLFVVLSFLFLIEFIDRLEDSSGARMGHGGLFCAAHLAFFALALFTKETAVFFCLIAAFYVLIVRGKSYLSREALVLAGGWGTLGVVWILARQAALAGRQAEVAFSSLWGNVVTNLPIFVAYIGKALLPLELSVWHSPADTSLVYGLVSLVALAGLVVISQGARPPYVTLGSLWFTVFLLPSLVVPILTGMEHRLYLPLVGILIVFLETDLTRQVDLRKRTNTAVAVALVVVLATFSFQRADAFVDKMSFWESAAATSPNSALAHLNLGAAFLDRAQLIEAEREFIRALEVNPTERMAHNNLGIVYARSGMLEEAEVEFSRELEINPGYADGYFNLGTLKMEMGEEEEAVRLWQRTVELNPQNLNAYASLVRYFLGRNEPELAAPYLERLQALGVDVSSLLSPQ